MKRRASYGLPLLLLLTACGQAELPQIEARLAELRERPGGNMTALPMAPAYQAVGYGQNGERNPFLSDGTGPVAAQTAQQRLAPDPNRPPEALESFRLDALRMVGTLTIDGQNTALIRDPEGRVHRLAVGERMGTDHGRIAHISRDSLELVELISDGLGGWSERNQKLTPNQNSNEQRQD